MKTLYFEGAGWSKADVGISDIPNCRIRTAFTNDEGKKIYLEILSRVVTGQDHKQYMRHKEYPVGTCLGFIDSCHYITDAPEIDDCNMSRLECQRNGFIIYTYESLLKFINETLCCSFDKIQVLNELTGYSVFSGKPHTETSADYNFGDEFDYDDEKTKKRLAKMEELKEYFQQFMKYDNSSYWSDENGNLVVRINCPDEMFKKMKFEERQFTVEIK